jgi:hypothetical protein
MRKIAVILVMALAAAVPAAMAQNHGEVGAFADYVRLAPFDTNHFGVGGRLSVNVHPNIQLEAETSYDFAKSFNETLTSNTGAVSINRTKVRIIHGEFGPKFQTGGQAIRAFLTLKGGFMNLAFSNQPATFGTFTSSFGNFTRNNTHPVFYPGGGLEFYAGIIGLRLDVGDEMWFNGGTHNSLRVAVGPSIRF